MLCAALPYCNTLFNGFVHDDAFQVLQNPYIRDTSHIRQIFTSSVWSFADANFRSNYYRPMMTLGYLACYKLFGLRQYGFHFINLLLHLCVVYLVFAISQRMFRDEAASFAAAAIFALHPIHTEPVAWIAAVTELELTFFFLIAFWFFLGLDGSRDGWKQFGMIAAFGLALLSKEQAMTFPVIATIYEHFYRADGKETTRGRKFRRYGPLWVLALGYIPWRTHCLGGFAPAVKFPDMTWYQSMLSALALIGQYTGKLLWPARLHAFYLFEKSVSFFETRVLFGLLVGLLALRAALDLWKRSPTASFGIGWMFVTLAPVLYAKWLGTNVFTERYAYLPSVGFCWGIAAGSRYLLRRVTQSHHFGWRAGFATAAGIVALLCVARIAIRNRDWRNNLVFYTRTLANMPEVPASNELRLNLGAELDKNGDAQGAERTIQTILRTERDHAAALSNLAALYMNQGRSVEAMAILLRVVQLAPKNAIAHKNLGGTYMNLAMFENAKQELRTAIRLEPTNLAAYADLARNYLKLGQTSQAEQTLREAVGMQPDDARIRYALGSFYESGGRNREAIREYEAVVKNDPENAAARAALRRLSFQLSLR